ncbi:MAG TPA: CheR family methyltransferase [Pyrinomonadaceae bacterium]|jgi:chemotaxis protein methyltransferase CheR|nr:CheR family methyltransferase [Pyrinomonadaceae bacterium]
MQNEKERTIKIGKMTSTTAQKKTDQLLLLCGLIGERAGLFFRSPQDIECVEMRLSDRLEKTGCGSFSEYHQLLSEGEKADAEWLQVIAALSKPVSGFYRHARRVRLLTEMVLPRLAANNGPDTLKIWSAGCATGEEPLMIAMAISEAGWFDRLEINIYASDASFTALEKAGRGIYDDNKVRHLAPELREKYFAPVNDEWQIKPELHGKVRWSLANLMNESEIAALAASHVIFCRNVFIYFSDPAIIQTLRLFGKHMPAGGYLITDNGDHFVSLISQTGVFERQEAVGESIWMKKEMTGFHRPFTIRDTDKKA